MPQLPLRRGSPTSPKPIRTPSGSATPTSETGYEDEDATILKPSLKQKLVGSKWFQQLNIGGALSGPSPKDFIQGSPSVEVQPHGPKFDGLAPAATELQGNAGKVRLVALCDNKTGIDSKELNFRRGDVLILERELDSEWIICCSESSGSRGLVPIQFVKKY